MKGYDLHSKLFEKLPVLLQYFQVYFLLKHFKLDIMISLYFIPITKTLSLLNQD